jgi:hypothetical protein
MTDSATLKNILNAYKPVSFVERRVINYARDRLGEGVEPADCSANWRPHAKRSTTGSNWRRGTGSQRRSS